MTRRVHRMPFGAQMSGDGRVQFRLWAPGASRVELALHTPEATRHLPMEASEDGWFELTTDAARAGSRYRYRIDGKLEVPDPASRLNSADVHQPSVVVDPAAFEWADASWRGRPWHEAIIYELHVGTFTPEGTFAAIEQKLDHLVQLGITFIELMPLADFPGARGWGYDGVLPYAPESAYGTPEELKHLIAAAHARKLGMMLDVVYNHFGPEGNYLHAYAPQFFTDRHETPWGAAINFDGPGSRAVRDFFIHNALYWLVEYHFDGLRFDAVHAIHDDSDTHILTELARAVRDGPGRERAIHLVLENNANQARFLGEPGARDTFDAQWNDDIHHCLHVIATGEADGYYVDYAQSPHALLCRGLADGFAYQGETSPHEGHARGEPSAHLPPSAFVNFLQNHDQIGNRAFGERLAHLVVDEAALLAVTAVALLSPAPPLLFMGEEWAAPEPFVYFCDFEPELAAKVRAGRRREFARFEKFQDPDLADRIPDPTSVTAFRSAKLDWSKLTGPRHARWLNHYRRLLAIRRRDIVPRIRKIRARSCAKLKDNGTFSVEWLLEDRSRLHLIANLSAHPAPIVQVPAGRILFATHPDIRGAIKRNELAPWSVTWLYERPVERRAVDRIRRTAK
jgi:maltooligosyltrehalose trehalohydrolase